MKDYYKDVEGYEGLYKVSNTGKLLSLRKNREMKLYSRGGYLGSSLQKEGSVKSFLIHREVAKAFINNPENKKCVNHKDGNKSNNHVDNLEWCTYLENQRHADSTGLRNIHGQNNGRAKLKPEDVLFIRENANKYNQNSLALKYGVTPQNIHLIIKRESWKSI